MTIQELKYLLCELRQDDDAEVAHHKADDALLEFISQFDPEIEIIFKGIKRWYA